MLHMFVNIKKVACSHLRKWLFVKFQLMKWKLLKQVLWVCLKKLDWSNSLKLELSDKKTWGDLDLNKVPMSKIYDKFGFCENTIDFLGHAVALHHSDTYLVEPAYDTLAKM